MFNVMMVRIYYKSIKFKVVPLFDSVIAWGYLSWQLFILSEGHFLVGGYSLVGDLISVSLGLKQATASGLDIFNDSGNSSDELISKLQLNGKFNLLKFLKHVCLNFVDT